MKDIFTTLIGYLTDKNVKLSQRAIIILLFSLFALIIDNTLGLSYHYRVSNKIEELQKVDLMLQNNKTDTIIRYYTAYLRDEIIERKSLIDYFSFRDMSFNLKQIKTNNPAANAIATEPIKNEFKIYFYAGFMFYFIGFLMAWFCLFGVKDQFSIIERIYLTIYAILTIGGCGYIFGLIFDLLPMFGQDWKMNYAISVVVQIAVFTVIFHLNNRRMIKDPEGGVLGLGSGKPKNDKDNKETPPKISN